jgi:cell division protein ZapA (FtsZ GTPase activity inhibitor)
MASFDTVIFDLDEQPEHFGDLADSVNHALANLGYPARTYATNRIIVGNGVAISRRAPSPARTR